MILPENIHHSRILFSPLNWGMGHVSRSIPLIKKLLKQNNTITLCGTEAQLKIYRHYFDSLTFLPFPGYPFSFSEQGFNSKKFIGQFARLYRAFRHEMKVLHRIQQEESFDFILSDHRYGFRCKGTHSIFITHQCQFALPWYLKIGQWVNAYFIKQFDTCWIIDDEKKRHAGELSKITHPQSAYIGLLSRFSGEKNPTFTSKTYKILLLNGPEAFHPLLLEAFKGISFDYIIGKSNHPEAVKYTQIQDWLLADQKVIAAHTIYSFCGYSTLMDTIALGAKWECIPTPGQWEQRYLYKIKKARE